MPTCTFYWGDSALSWIRWMTLCSFRLRNPEWGIRLLTSPIGRDRHWEEVEINQDQFTYHGKDWRDRLDELGVVVEEYSPPVETSANTIGDIARWDVLSQGGVYADMDIIFLKGFDEDAARLLTSTHALSCESGYLYLGLTGSPGGKLFADIRDEAIARHEGRYQASGVNAVYRYAYGHDELPLVHGLDTLQALRDKSGEEVERIPIRWVHPFTDPEDVWTRYPGDSYGLHWYAGSRKGQEASVFTHDHAPTPVGELARQAWTEYRGHDG